MKKMMAGWIYGICAVGLLLSSAVYASDDEPQIPVGSRLVKLVPSDPEARPDCGSLNEKRDTGVEEESLEAAQEPESEEVFRMGLFISDAIHPGATHQVVEYIHGPFTVPLIDGRVYVLPAGIYVRLEDTSIWRVADDDIWAVQDWLPSDSLHLTSHRTWFGSRYQYNLVNLNTQVQVRVCPEVGPRLNWSLRRFIYDRSLIDNEVVLNDGSLWRVTSSDACVFSKWLPDDSIIIGVNTDWMSFRRAMLLINLTTNDCVRCSWIR